MEDCIVGYLFLGLIIGIVVGTLITVGLSEDSSEIRDKLIETQNSLKEVITERDTYKNLILEKSLEE